MSGIIVWNVKILMSAKIVMELNLNAITIIVSKKLMVLKN